MLILNFSRKKKIPELQFQLTTANREKVDFNIYDTRILNIKIVGTSPQRALAYELNNYNEVQINTEIDLQKKTFFYLGI